MNSLATPFRSIFRHRRLLSSSLMTDLKQRNAGSIGGMLWLVIYPLFLFSVYASVYLFIFRIRPIGMTRMDYIVYILSGLLPFISISEALTTGTQSISAKRSLLLNTVYPSEFIPLQTVMAAHISSLVGFSFLFLVDLCLGHPLTANYLFLPVLLIFQIMFTSGVSWLLCIYNLVLKDIQQALGLFIVVLLFISPIAYTPEMTPTALKPLLWINPLAYFIRAYQELFLHGTISYNFYIAAALGIGSFYAGYFFFCRVKTVFYDYA